MTRTWCRDPAQYWASGVDRAAITTGRRGIGETPVADVGASVRVGR